MSATATFEATDATAAYHAVEAFASIEHYVCPSCPDTPSIRGEHVRRHVRKDRAHLVRPTVRTVTFGCDHCRRVFQFRQVLSGGQWCRLPGQGGDALLVLRPQHAREFWKHLGEVNGEVQLSAL
jgi:hypothetical protein